MQLLAVIPGREESCRQAINMVCDNFERSELGVKITCEAATGVSKEAISGDNHSYLLFEFLGG